MYDKIVDADAHVLEPMDLWEEYLEPGFRERGIKWRTNAEGETGVYVPSCRRKNSIAFSQASSDCAFR